MIYENPEPPEGINSGRRRPLRDFAVLGGGTALAAAAAVIVMLTLADWLAPLVPFEWERALAPWPTETAGDAETRELQALADRLAVAMALDDDITVTVHVDESPAVNAYATVGGHVFVTRGLIEAMPDQAALAWVLGHEIAHVKHRDVARAMGGQLVLSLVLAATMGDAGWLETLAGSGGQVASLHFSRRREEAADAASLEALVALEGNGRGYAGALRALDDAYRGLPQPPVILSSHPEIDARVARLDALADANGWPVGR